ncbi:CotO family spore coat protein [Aquibacillus rhizosphaerae]|uniref:CotO family spore coat protein n=1 Tax=Aquibacillus rhizosphaerae TaxID=3051431 RepID=A0ABT7LBY9_9BACI|nr:CotO family spore coat protein [Aquibacillus sp. LR5S19]MDL4842944.1 CotO family spore coat protein [Aquibacillus sp. LR5S19]
MKRKKAYAKNPMLYISQPEFKQPTASMQSKYRTPKKKKERQPMNLDVSDRAKKIKKKKPKVKPIEKEEKDFIYGDQEDVIEEIQDDNNEKSEKTSDESVDTDSEYVTGNEDEGESKSNKKDENQNKSVIRPQTGRKRFGDMTIEEKIYYFVGLPSQVPRMKCEVLTENERHRGVITDYRDEFVHMITVKRPRNKTIPIDEIKKIRLISF